MGIERCEPRTNNNNDVVWTVRLKSHNEATPVWNTVEATPPHALWHCFRQTSTSWCRRWRPEGKMPPLSWRRSLSEELQIDECLRRLPLDFRTWNAKSKDSAVVVILVWCVCWHTCGTYNNAVSMWRYPSCKAVLTARTHVSPTQSNVSEDVDKISATHDDRTSKKSGFTQKVRKSMKYRPFKPAVPRATCGIPPVCPFAEAAK